MADVRLEDLKAEVRKDLTAAEKRRDALGAIEVTMDQLRSFGFEIELFDRDGRLCLGTGIQCALGPVVEDKLVERKPATEAFKALQSAPKANPVPEPVKKKLIKAARKKPKTEIVTGPWSDDETDLMVSMVAEGHTTTEIASFLNREVKSVKNKAFNCRDRINALRAKSKQDPEGVVPASQLVPPDPSIDRQTKIRLDNIGYIEPWTPELDLKLVEMLSSGDGRARVAEVLDIPSDRILNRWNLLNPEKTIESQTKLIKELRRRVALGNAA